MEEWDKKNDKVAEKRAACEHNVQADEDGSDVQLIKLPWEFLSLQRKVTAVWKQRKRLCW
jgi:hypothetical protein